MQNHKSNESWEELEVLFRNLNKVAYDFSYEIHPDDITLDRYVHNALIRDIDPVFSSDQEFQSLLHGESGWTRTSISLHIVSCDSCRASIDALRDAYQEQTESSVSWWGQLQESSEDTVRLPSFKKSAIALGVLALLVVTSFSIFDRGDMSVSETDTVVPGGIEWPAPGGGESSDSRDGIGCANQIVLAHHCKNLYLDSNL